VRYINTGAYPPPHHYSLRFDVLHHDTCSIINRIVPSPFYSKQLTVRKVDINPTITLYQHPLPQGEGIHRAIHQHGCLSETPHHYSLRFDVLHHDTCSIINRIVPSPFYSKQLTVRKVDINPTITLYQHPLPQGEGIHRAIHQHGCLSETPHHYSLRFDVLHHDTCSIINRIVTSPFYSEQLTVRKVDINPTITLYQLPLPQGEGIHRAIHQHGCLFETPHHYSLRFDVLHHDTCSIINRIVTSPFYSEQLTVRKVDINPTITLYQLPLLQGEGWGEGTMLQPIQHVSSAYRWQTGHQ
jgi:hypothetical protein